MHDCPYIASISLHGKIYVRKHVKIMQQRIRDNLDQGMSNEPMNAGFVDSFGVL